MFLKPLENTGSFKNPAAQTERRSFGAVNIGIFEQAGACQNGQKSSLGREQLLAVTLDELNEPIFERVTQFGYVFQVDDFFEGVAAGDLRALDEHVVRRPD